MRTVFFSFFQFLDLSSLRQEKSLKSEKDRRHHPSTALLAGLVILLPQGGVRGVGVGLDLNDFGVASV
jgi:hypothetical protein